MSYLIDTNVVSELRRKAPAPNVQRWFNRRPAGTLHVSVLTLGDIRKGIDSMPVTPRRLALLDWLEVDLPAFFSGRVLAVDSAVADRWGQIVAAAGRPLPAIDSLLVATALQHGLILVTRNRLDVAGLGVQIVDPWDD